MTYLCAKLSQMRKTYKVAGHRFAIVMPDGEASWNEMGNYEPFIVDDSDDCVCVVEQIQDFPDTSKMEKVTTCCNAPLEPRFEVYEEEGCRLMEIAPTFETPICCRVLMNKDFSNFQFQVINYWQFSFNTMMKMLFAFATASKGTLQIHASVTMKDHRGYLFLGNSGTGKSTHSQLWINNIEGCSLLNDDNPVLRIDENGVFRVYGSPWSGKTPCYRNMDVPIGALVKLRQAKQNVIRKLSVTEAYATIYPSFTGMKFVKEMADAYHATNFKLISTVPFYELDCLPDADAAFLCYKTVSKQ